MSKQAVNILWTTAFDETGLATLVERVCSELTSHGAFCVWLIGPLGAGKTTVTGKILRGLGLDERIPVTSPTYTYMNEYQIAGRWYAHLDLYRTKGAVSPEDLGLADARPFYGSFVEWPELSPDNLYLQPTHSLKIDFTSDPATRTFTLTRRV